MAGTKYIKLLAIAVGVAVVDIIAFSPGFIGLRFGDGALATASGATLLAASALALLYGCYTMLAPKPVVAPVSVKQIKTREDYAEALARYRRVRSLQGDVDYALEQTERLRKKKEALLQALGDRFDPNELSYKKFASVIEEVDKLFYLNLRSLLNRLGVFDEAEFESLASGKPTRFSREIADQKTALYNDFLAFMKSSLGANEEILLKLDKLLLEISRLDSLEPGDIEQMPFMQEIDALIKQTKYYK